MGQDEGTGSTQYLPYPPPLGMPGVVLSGWAYPLSDVTVLKDGQEVGKALANDQAAFGAFLEELEQGVYTFGLWAQDALGYKSPTFSTTFWIDAGTQTTVSDIILPPTVALNENELDAGEVIILSGYSVPDQTVEAWLYPSELRIVDKEHAVAKEALVGPDGRWTIIFPTTSMDNDSYKIKARTIITDIGTSEFSHELELSIGGVVGEGICAGADLNGDGRVNLVDFSILLFYWSTDDECADQNKDGTVDLIDFSIMMFYWTG